ncbi:hypothetical protein [Cylindrospermopsis raciborskii]|uniref:hypothetical protein n=1 Tax=Cylindrospermopsis raciborskii TaxID=77022 RepID=UPI001365552E|nr:hypothetical protein [Cylindrospermopsis raciborskii]
MLLNTLTEKIPFSSGIFWRMVKSAISRSECFANAVGVLRKCTGLTAMRSQPMFQNHK